MSTNYLVVSAANSEITRLAIGMLGARYLEETRALPYTYPMEGSKFYVWDAKPNEVGDQVAFGPIETGLDEAFGSWLLGKELVIDDGGLSVSITLPSETQSLDDSWFSIASSRTA